MDNGSTPRPDVVSRVSSTTIARLSVVVLVVGLVVCLAVFILLARVLDGVVRVVVLGLLAPVVLVIALILWQAIHAVRSLGGRRDQRLAEMREQRIIGVLAYPAIPGWNERLQRHVVLPTVPHLLVVNPETIDTERGQYAMAVLGDLIGRPPPPSGEFSLPGRATLALVDDESDRDGTASIWDISTLIERADAGDEAAREELYELQLYLQQRAMDAANNLRS